MTLSVQAKVTVATLLAVALGLALAGWLAFRYLDKLELQQITEDLKFRTGLASTSLAPLLLDPHSSLPNSQLQQQARHLSKQAGARVTVIDGDGRVLADSATEDDRVPLLENHGTRPEVLQARESGMGTNIRRSETTGQRLFYLALPLHVEGTDSTQHAPIVRLALPLTTLDAHAANLQRNLFLALLVAFLCAVVLSLLIAKNLTRPLSDMAEVARHLASGELHRRVQVEGTDEVGTLGATLNHMADQLEQTVREVSEDRAQLRAMLTAMVEGVMVLDIRGIVLQTNPAFERMLVTPGQKVQGRAHWEVIRHPELNRLAHQVLETHRNYSREIFLSSNGHTFRVEASAAGGTRENEACAVLVFHEITALRRLEQVRKDFVANVSHELRTPLTSIQGYAQALKDDLMASPEQFSSFVDIILKQSERLNILLEDLLHLSQIESGEVTLRQAPVPLGQLIDRSLAMVLPQIEKKHHEINVSLPDNLPPVLGDEDRLLQVFTNLLDNATKYTPANGIITVTGQVVPEHHPLSVEVVVSDTGIGIPPPDRPRIFERFYRVDKARSQELGGTGLGLSIVKHIVERHTGHVRVEGNEPRGSRFIVQLPAAQTEEAKQAESG